ncbi:MAG: hypothetical protein JWM14_3201 [Chitinophagaceae bacterium]|nr:hypothetical protein [Chitinophagaceae bacterium]
MRNISFYTMLSESKYLMKILTVCLLNLIPFMMSAQDVVSDLQKIKMTHAGFSAVSYETEYRSYLNKLTEKPVDVTYGSLIQQGDNKYQKIADIEIISNKNYTFTVDHTERHMYYSPSYLNMKAESAQVDVTKIMDYCSIEKQETVDATHKAYILVPKLASDDFERVRLVYDTKTFMINELQLNYAKSMEYVVKGTPVKGKPIMVVVYKNYKINQTINEQVFTYHKFVKKEKDKLVIKDTYKNYTINGGHVLAIKNN